MLRKELDYWIICDNLTDNLGNNLSFEGRCQTGPKVDDLSIKTRRVVMPS
jgi:hypothetical protein